MPLKKNQRPYVSFYLENVKQTQNLHFQLHSISTSHTFFQKYMYSHAHSLNKTHTYMDTHSLCIFVFFYSQHFSRLNILIAQLVHVTSGYYIIQKNFKLYNSRVSWFILGKSLFFSYSTCMYHTKKWKYFSTLGTSSS